MAGEPSRVSGRIIGVDKRGAKSDEAYAREVLGEMARARNLRIMFGACRPPTMPRTI